MRALSVLLLIFLSFSVMANKAREVLKHWTVTGASYLQINGTTNINAFQCGADYESDNDLIRERWMPESEKWVIFGSIFIDVEDFECSNRIMNNDFKNTLDYTNYPEIKVEFLNLKETDIQGNSRIAQGWVAITLVGKTKKYLITSELEFLDDYYSILRGKQDFYFSDFGIEPPQKGLGMIKVNDKLTVSFELILEQTVLTEN